MKIIFLLVFLVIPGQWIIAQNTFRIMSYNIHHGEGMDQRVDYSRIADWIEQVAPDVVALQEVDSVTLRSDGVDQLHELADRVLMHRIFAPTIPFQKGKYGIGVLSKEKPLNYTSYVLPGREEQRVLLVVEFQKYIFCCTHFSLTPEDQMASIPLIIDVIKDLKKPVFLAGDFNAVPDSPTITELKKTFRILTNPKMKTYPADAPEECLDYILGYAEQGNAYTVLNSRVMDAPKASDHRPVVAEVRLKTELGCIFRTRPYLQNPINNGITITWLTNVPVNSWVEYGMDTLHVQQAWRELDGQKVCNDCIHKVRLENLKPGENYYYRVCSREILSYQAYSKSFGDTAVSPYYTFRLPEENKTDFTALVFNDIHNQYKTMAALYDQVKDVNYDFVIFNGDCFDAPANEEAVVNPLVYYNDKVGASHVPVFYLRGNHEIRSAYSLRIRQYLNYVGDKTYGAFSWGDTRFVLLDCGEDKKDDHWVYYGLNDFSKLRKDQAAFLNHELSSKPFKNATKRILIHHIPVYGNTDEYQPCTELWGDLLRKAPFHVSLNAHTHEYAFHPKGSLGNNFPVFVGGGYSMKDATVMILTKKGERMTIKVLNTQGKLLKELDL